MTEKIRAVIDRIETEQRQGYVPIPDDISITELAEQVVRGKVKLSQPQMRMLIELLPYYAPKLQAIASFRPDDRDFAVRLEKAIDRMHRTNGGRTKLIEGRVLLEQDEE